MLISQQFSRKLAAHTEHNLCHDLPAKFVVFLSFSSVYILMAQHETQVEKLNQ